jgi:hypothetical protein
MRLERFVQSAQLSIGDARADAPRKGQAPRVVVVGEQQGAEVRPGAFGLRVPDDGELLSLVAFALVPKATITRAHMLRSCAWSNALGLGAARRTQEALAVGDVVVAVLNGSRRRFEQCL